MIARGLIMVLLLGGVSLPADAQSLEREKRSNGWLSSGNAAGLRAFREGKISEAELFFNREGGGMVNHHEATSQFSWGARTGSFFRLDRAVLHGEIIYKNYKGKNTGGTTFIDPGYAPFNIVEQADTNRGTRSAEEYTLVGAVGVPLYRALNAGGKIIYTTANRAKHKDPRYKNTLLDMTVSAGLSYRFGNRVEVGINYDYRRTIEETRYKVYGNTDRQFLFLVDFGLFTGRVELFGETGYSSSDGPLFNAFHGGSLQVELPLRRWSLFQELTGRRRHGYFGEKSTSSICYSDHEGSMIAYRGLLSARGEVTRLVEWSFSRETIENSENIYRHETTPGGLSRVVYHGKVKVLSGNATRASLSCTSRRGLVAGQPAWEWSAGGDYAARSRTVSLYPFFRQQHLHAYRARLSAGHHRRAGQRDAVGFSLEIAYGRGSGEAKQDGLYAKPSDDQAAPRNVDHLLYREHEYLTIPRVEGSASITYHAPLFPGNVQGYARARAFYRRALEEVQYLGGASARAITVGVGCLF
ncbi:MAG: hypothetical protein LBD64_03020 [Odoribacteraceae bacterium]|jgi:hypothetical protein|nr:hypothetical protein [Odoribacteraceae bacterium]